MNSEDSAGDAISTMPSSWTFDSQNVVDNFDNHVSKSVPLYSQAHELIRKTSDFFLQSNKTVLDIGCSTGHLLASLHDRHLDKDTLQFFGLDPSSQMIEACSKRYGALAPRLNFLNQGLLDCELEPGSVTFATSVYTFQFIPPAIRQDCFDKVYRSLSWSGAFLLFEKVRAPDARFQDIMSQIYTEYKLDQGYTSSQILTKSRSLKGILEPFSSAANIDYLKRAGFQDVMTIFKYCSFEGFLAIK